MNHGAQALRSVWPRAHSRLANSSSHFDRDQYPHRSQTTTPAPGSHRNAWALAGFRSRAALKLAQIDDRHKLLRPGMSRRRKLHPLTISRHQTWVLSMQGKHVKVLDAPAYFERCVKRLLSLSHA